MQISDRRLTVLGMHYRPEVTGNAPYTTSLAETLAGADVAVTAICSHPHYPEWKIRSGYGRWRQHESIGDVNVTRVRHWVPRDPSSASRLVSELTFGLRQAFTRWHRPDAILLVSPAMFASAIAMIRARRTHARRVIWVQDVYSAGVREIGGAGGFVTSVIRCIEAQTFKSADIVVVIHDSFRRILVDELGVPSSKIRTIPNWAHISADGPSDRSAVRARLGWPNDQFIALHAGNQGLKQGLDNLIRAGQIVDNRGLPIRIVLLGSGSQNARLRERALGIKCIDFMESVTDEDFLPTLQAADALLVNEEVGVSEMSVPSKLTSYFSAGRPVVGACAIGGGAAAELAASGAGLRVDPGRPEDLTDLLSAMQLDPTAYESLGESGLRYREQSLGISSAIAAFSDVLFGADWQGDTGHCSDSPCGESCDRPSC